MSKFLLYLPYADLPKSASLLVFVTFGNMGRSVTIIRIRLFHVQSPHLLSSLPVYEVVPIHTGKIFVRGIIPVQNRNRWLNVLDLNGVSTLFCVTVLVYSQFHH